MDDLDALERRVDKLEQRNAAEDAVATATAAQSAKRHTSWQFVLTIVSTVIMLVNLYISFHPHK